MARSLPLDEDSPIGDFSNKNACQPFSLFFFFFFPIKFSKFLANHLPKPSPSKNFAAMLLPHTGALEVHWISACAE